MTNNGLLIALGYEIDPQAGLILNISRRGLSNLLRKPKRVPLGSGRRPEPGANTGNCVSIQLIYQLAGGWPKEAVWPMFF